jgi:hypothetical protein
MPTVDANDVKVGRGSKPLRFPVLLFIISLLIQAAGPPGQYKLVAWQGDVKVRRDGKFIPLSGQTEVLLNRRDAIFIPGGAAVELLFPGGIRRKFKGPRLTAVGTLKDTNQNQESEFLANLMKITGLDELLSREKEEVTGATRGDESESSIYKEIIRAIRRAGPAVRDMPIDADKKKEMNQTLALIDSHFDAAAPGKQLLIKAKIYKLFNQHDRALMTVFNRYKELLEKEGTQNERKLLVLFLFHEFLPIVIHFSADVEGGRDILTRKKRNSITFSAAANFKLWWAAAIYDGRELKVIEKTIDHSRYPREQFELRRDITVNNNNVKLFYLFIIACTNWTDLETFDDMEEVRRELLERDIPDTASTRVSGFGKVVIKIRPFMNL